MTTLVLLALQASVAATVFGYGLQATAADLLYVFSRKSLLVRSLIAVLVVMPVVAVAIGRLFDSRHVVEVALLALSISPVPPLLPMRHAKAGGRASYGLGLLALLAALSIVSTPLAIEVLERVFARPLAPNPLAVARLAAISVLAPLAAGVVVRRVAPVLAERMGPALAIGARALLLAGIVGLIAGLWRSIWDATGEGAILAMVVFVVAGFAVGHMLGGPERDHAVVLGLSTACRHPAIAFTIASSNFPEERFGGAIVLYLLVTLLVGIPYVQWNRRARERGE